MKLPEKKYCFFASKVPPFCPVYIEGVFSPTFRSYVGAFTPQDCAAEMDVLQKAVSMRKNEDIEKLRQPMDEITRKKYCFFASKVPPFCPVYSEGVFSPTFRSYVGAFTLQDCAAEMDVSQKLSACAKIRTLKSSDGPWMKLPEKNIAFLFIKYHLSVLYIVRGFFLSNIPSYIWTAAYAEWR